MICPTCKRAFTPPNSPDAKPPSPVPFCSARCRAADLGSWLSGNYRIVTPASADEMAAGPDPAGATTQPIN